MTGLSFEFTVYLFFLQSKVESHLAQMLEEAVIFIYDDAMQADLQRHQPLIQFLEIALEFIELAICKHHQEYFPLIRLCLNRVNDRLQSLLHKKDNAILSHFL